MKNIQIKDSYGVWDTVVMLRLINEKCKEQYGIAVADCILHRTYKSMYIEWWLHNIGYWITLPFIKNVKMKKINERCKHVDLEEHL